MKADKAKTENRGGARKGAGRPRLDGQTARRNISIRVTPENAALLDRMKAGGIHLGMAFDTIIPELAARYGID